MFSSYCEAAFILNRCVDATVIPAGLATIPDAESVPCTIYYMCFYNAYEVLTLVVLDSGLNSGFTHML